MPIQINNVPRRVVYAASGTGPYAFTFEILAAGDIAVYRDDTLLTITTDYTVTIASNGTGSVTLTAAPTGATQIAIVGNRTIQRTTDFTTGGDFFANTVNDELDQQTIFAQQNAEGLSRALQAPQTDPTTINMILPRASTRANKTLAFDADGNPTTGEIVGNWRGNWASGTAYAKRDLIKDTSNANVYICVTAHTSSGSQPISTNADSAKWALMVDAASANAAQVAAEAAQAAAETAETNAETAETNAETAATNAASSASAASTSATNASNSATAAAGSASTASTQATNASNSATAAAASASAASTSETNAASSASSASTSASNASTSATNASNSASSASTSATNAANSASAASTSATNASSSATAAAASETAAAASATAAAASYDSFDDRYLGAKTANPSVDNDGNALITGALYFNSSAGEMRVYTGSQWVAATVSPDTISEVEFSATAGQTTYSYTSGYRVGYTYIWVNGVMLADADFTATDGTNITFGTALSLNDEVRIITFKAIGSVAIGDITGLQTALDGKQDDITVNGIVKGNGSGTLSAAVAGTDYLAPAAIGTTVQAWDADLDTWAGKTAPSGTVVGTSDTQTLTNKTLTDPAIVGTILEDVYTISDGAAFEIDPGNGSIQLITLGANRTPKATNFAAGEAVTLMVDDGSAATLTWTDATFGGSGVVWKTNAGVAPTLNTSGYTVITLWKVGSQVYGARVGDA